MRRAIAQPLTYHGWFAQMSSRAKKENPWFQRDRIMRRLVVLALEALRGPPPVAALAREAEHARSKQLWLLRPITSTRHPIPP